MRNDTPNSSIVGMSDFTMVDGTTVATTSTDTTGTSFVQVGVPGTIDTVPALTMKTTPKNETIGRNAKDDVAQICVTLTARDLPTDDESSGRAPVDIIVALDISSSMRGSKIELCKTTLELLLRVLQPLDRFGLIVYSYGAHVSIPAQKMTDRNKKSCLKTIQALKAHGQTNISAALGLAYQEMNVIEKPNEVRAVFLLTDGQPNQGISDHNGLVTLVKNSFKSHDATLGVEGMSLEGGSSVSHAEKAASCSSGPMSLHCFGYGQDHNSKLLSDLAMATMGGSYYYVEDDKNVGTAFGDALGGIMSVVAQNVSVMLSVPKDSQSLGVTIQQVFHDEVIKRENGSVTAMMGDFYAEESRDLLLEVKLASLSSIHNMDSSKIPHVAVVVAYTDTLQKQPVTSVPLNCGIYRPPDSSTVSKDDKHVKAQWLRHSTTETIEQASKLANEGKLDQAKAILHASALNLQRSSSELCQDEDAEEIILLEQLEKDVREVIDSFKDKQQYRSHGVHLSRQIGHQYKQQRAMMSRECAAEEMSPQSMQGTTDWQRSAGYKMSKCKVAVRKRMKIPEK